jgi:predicted GIY-YIG superfamily endonuclease
MTTNNEQLELNIKDLNIKEEEKWSFYIIVNKCFTYAGVSPDVYKRLRKHNGELAGGAIYTTSKGKGWKHLCLVHGFQTKQQALQFEWALKHMPPRNLGGLDQRVKKLYALLNKPKWTSKSIDAKLVPLTVEWKMEVKCENRNVPDYIKEVYKESLVP